MQKSKFCTKLFVMSFSLCSHAIQGLPHSGLQWPNEADHRALNLKLRQVGGRHFHAVLRAACHRHAEKADECDARLALAAR